MAHVLFNLWYPVSSVYVFLGKGGCEGVGKERWRWKTNDQWWRHHDDDDDDDDDDDETTVIIIVSCFLFVCFFCFRTVWISWQKFTLPQRISWWHIFVCYLFSFTPSLKLTCSHLKKWMLGIRSFPFGFRGHISFQGSNRISSPPDLPNSTPWNSWFHGANR